MKSLKSFALCLSLGLALIFSACNQQQAGTHQGRLAMGPKIGTEDKNPKEIPTLRIAIITDLTLSAMQNSTPPVQAADVRRLVEVITEQGGEIGIFPVKAQAEGGLLRFHVDPPASRPLRPDEKSLKHLSVFEQRDQWSHYREELKKWSEEEEQRRAQASMATQKFEAQLPSILLAKQTGKKSDVYSSLLRVDRFLGEKTAEPNLTMRRILLICSDLVDTKSGQVYALTSNPTTAWVFREATPPGRLPGVTPVMFESVEPAIAWMIQQGKEENR
jgi:hypothetical protein